MEAIFQEVKEKQEATDKTFEEQQQLEILEKKSLPLSDKKVSKSRSRKPSGPVLGSTVRIVSGPFLDFSGTIKKLDRKRGSVCIISFFDLILHLMRLNIESHGKETCYKFFSFVFFR